MNWIDDLVAHLAAKPIALLRLDAAEWAAVASSKHGVDEFTIAIHNEAFASLRAPTLCILIAASDRGLRVMVGVTGPH